MVLCFSVGFKEGSLEMSDWLEQPEEGGMDSNDQTKGKEEDMETITGNGMSAEDQF